MELSIVLVILGLLTGGILTGQSLIRASELRSISTDIQRFQAATQTFRDKYFALPGDMSNAQSFWGVAHATPATCKTTASTTPLTCNGDGNGIVQHTAAGSNEVFRYWQHLASAGLMEGTYSGVQGPNGNIDAVIGTNVPRSKISNAGYSMLSGGVMSGDPNFFDGDYNNLLSFGTEFAANGGTILPALKNEEAWNVDTKLDDGKPAYGTIRTYKNANQVNCATTDVESTAAYNLTNSSIACMLMIRGM